MKAALIASALLTGCMVGPDYHRPDAVGLTPAFKEAPPGWVVAEPQDTARKGGWWLVYGDPLLDGLEERVVIDNQNVAQYEGLYREAKAAVEVSRAGLYPTLSGTTGGTRSSQSGSGGRAATLYTAEGGASWDLDVWGRIRRQVESDAAAAQVSAADLANATLSAQATLATDYFGLRYQDALGRLLQATVSAYADTLRITRNQYVAGISSAADVASAQTQLDSARAQLAGVGVQRSQYEHAIAVLAGLAPAQLSIPTGSLAVNAPVVPGEVPSLILQRRPDIASAERKMQQQNALIGVRLAAYYPDITLSADFGFSSATVGTLLNSASKLWSFGASATQALYDGGLRRAEVTAARAAYDAAVAAYRQTVLTAFQQVEDELAALRILERQAAAAAQAVRSAQRSVDLALNAYRAGTSAYTSVVTQQTALLTDQQTALLIQQNRLLASVSLVQALGGGFAAK